MLYITMIICMAPNLYAIELESPLKRTLQLTGNFGELRTNHFHTGLDFRAAIGTPVYAVDSGYVSRVSVAAGGYGNALYITHPSTGVTSVYAHLNHFAPEIEKLVTAKQYELEYYAVDLNFSPNTLKVERDQIVAYTGNRGSSGGPHLHFEIRDTQTENPLEPLNYIKNNIQDSRKPVIKSIAILPKNGVINGKPQKYIVNTMQQAGKKVISRKVNAWGDIIFALKAYDYMNGMNNIYGVHYVKLYMNDELIYSSHIDTLSFAKGRQINTYIDTEEWIKNRSLYMRSYISPGNTLNFYEENYVKNRGVVTIDKEQLYNFRYEVIDYYGNSDCCEFEILGVKTEIPQAKEKTIKYDKEYRFETELFNIEIPQNALYEDSDFEYSKTDTVQQGNYSVIHTLNPYYEVLDRSCCISLKVERDIIDEKEKYYIASLHSLGKKKGEEKTSYLSKYQDGWLSAKVNSFGEYVIKADLVKPILKYYGVVAGELRIMVKDEESGLKYFRGEIDGEFVLFTYDMKDKIARYKIDTQKYPQGIPHSIEFEAYDNCGNKKSYKGTLKY